MLTPPDIPVPLTDIRTLHRTVRRTVPFFLRQAPWGVLHDTYRARAVYRLYAANPACRLLHNVHLLGETPTHYERSTCPYANLLLLLNEHVALLMRALRTTSELCIVLGSIPNPCRAATAVSNALNFTNSRLDRTTLIFLNPRTSIDAL